MSFGTFMDSLLFNVQADLGTLAGSVSHVTAPITPEFVFERRQGKRAEALAKLDLGKKEKNKNDTKYKKAKNENTKPVEASKTETKVSIPLAIETTKADPVENIDQVLKQLANMANDAVKRNEFVEQLKSDHELMSRISTYMASEIAKDIKKEVGDDKEIPAELKVATIDSLIGALQGMKNNIK